MARGGKEKDESEERPQDRYRSYEDELLSANWNPVIALMEWSCARTAETARADNRNLTEEDVDDFLSRIYTSGT